MTVFYYTFGCKVNQYETDCICEEMTAKGYMTVKSIDLADVVIINTCTVTGSADVKLKQLLSRIRRSDSKIITAVCGCFSQVYPNSDILKDVDIIVGENNKSELPDLIDKYLSDGKRTVHVLPHERREKIESTSLSSRPEKTRAIIKIQDGCDRFCSYCIIPYARGRSRSKPLHDIEKEAKALVASGHKELVLVGINLSCYGADLSPSADLSDAVKLVCRTRGANRVRLGSIEPEMLTEEIIDKLAEEEKLCPHFHLSLQSGCDKTLSEMRRKYDKVQYFTLVSTLRERFKGCAITTDVMVGFPGETDEDFNESLEFVKIVGFAKVHVFPYSERKGTLAAKRSDQVPINVRNHRAEIMTKAAKVGENEFLRSLIGFEQDVLFEKERDTVWHQGHTPNYTLVKVKRFTDSLRGSIHRVKIVDVENGYCIGEIVK